MRTEFQKKIVVGFSARAYWFVRGTKVPVFLMQEDLRLYGLTHVCQAYGDRLSAVQIADALLFALAHSDEMSADRARFESEWSEGDTARALESLLG